jgi:hypothetical protein
VYRFGVDDEMRELFVEDGYFSHRAELGSAVIDLTEAGSQFKHALVKKK